ncbi:MAG: tetratricopeptide repeat protein, partial [Elusimicrobia bacterium]|nr:tetratricopeptide repeat protein [Elusimicrobiota bacterium]
MASALLPNARRLQGIAAFGGVLAATALLVSTARPAFAECTDDALDAMATSCGEARFGHDAAGNTGSSSGGAGTQGPTVDEAKCKQLAGSLGRACTEAYDREMLALKNAKSKEEVNAIDDRLDKIVTVIHSFKDDVADGEFIAGTDPAVKALLDLKTEHTDRSVEAALERVTNPAGTGEKPSDTPGGKPTPDPSSGKDVPGPGGQTTASAENRVEDLLKNGDYAGALALLDGLGSQGVQSPRLEAMRSMALLNAGDKDGALKAAERALKLDPDNSDARQVKLYLEAGGQVKDTQLQVKRPDFGAQRLGSELGGGSGDSLAMNRRPGRAVGEAGDGPGAPGAVPGSPGGWAAWGPGSQRDEGTMGGRAGAPTGTSSAQPLTPSQTLVMVSLKKARLGDMSGALLEATRAIQADKANARAWTVRAGVSNRLKNHDAAISDATEALKLEPKSVPALLERGFAQYSLANYSSALSDIGEALKLEPLNALAYLYRGMVFEKMARVTEALSDYE